MLRFGADDKHVSRVADFYHGKSVFVTGAAGFIGSVLLETLLRCCPGICSIYILLRSKKNVQPETRKKHIFNKKIFKRFNEEDRGLLDKVHVIAGDCELPNLGMNEADKKLLIAEVSIVFHTAAMTHFDKPLKFALLNNVLSLNTIIELCREMRKFEALVYTSTAYCNSNHTEVTLKEEVYRLPFRAERFLDALKNEDDQKLQELFSHCKPNWANTYTFSKCLAENLLMDTASDLPISIVRPSMVFWTWKQPISGYIETKTVSTLVLTGIGNGFLKVLHADPNVKLNFVPADIVSNAHALAAWTIGTKRCSSPLIVHCTATEKCHITISEFKKIITQFVIKNPLPESFTKTTDCIIVPWKYVYNIISAYHHYLPAIILDATLKILGKKPRIYSSYRFVDKFFASSSAFRFHTFEFDRNNLEHLDKLIHPADRKDLSLDFRDASLQNVIKNTTEVCPFYDWKIDKKSPAERQKSKYRMHMAINCIQGIFILIIALLLCWIVSLLS